MKNKFSSALSLALIVSMLFTSVAFADDVSNNLDFDVDATLESTTLTAGGANKVVDMYTVNRNGDGKNGCNLTGSTTLVVDVVSSDPTVASVSPAQLTFTNCEGVLTNLTTAVTVTPLSAGTADITLSEVSNNTGGTFNLAPASFRVIVNAPAPSDTTAPVITPNISGTLGNNGWYTSDVTVSWTVVDNESTPTYSCPPTTINADTAGTTLTCSATSAGGTSSQSVTIKRDATQPGVVWGGGINNGDTFTYGSVPAAPTCTASDGMSGPASCAVTGYGASVGGHTLTATAYDNAGNFKTETRSYTVNKADAACSISGYTGEYDALPHGASGSCSGIGGEEAGTLDLGATFTDVPGDTAYWTFTGNGNYNDQSGSVSIVITQAPSTVTITCPASVTYNGFAQEPCTAVVTGVGSLNQALTVTYSNNTNAGTATASASYLGGLNHAASNNSTTFEIEKADATCTVNGYTGTYDGNVHGATGSCTGVLGEDLSAGLNLGASFTDVPGGTAYWTFSGGTNYNDQNGSVDIVINKAPVTATAGSGSSTYDGAAHSPSACVVTGDYTGDLTCANDPASVGPNAGTYTISPVVNGTGLGNFEVTSVNGSYTINKADPLCAVTGYNVVYDGFDHTATGACTGVLGETLSGLDLSGTTHILVGNYTDTWTFTDVTGNYNNASGTVNDVIQAWNLTGFYQPVDMGGVFNTIKGGSTVPLKFEIFAGTTELKLTSYVTGFSALAVPCPVNGFVADEIEVLATGGTSLRFDTTGDQFIFNWQTPKKPGACYKVTMTTLDGSSLSAFFKLK